MSVSTSASTIVLISGANSGIGFAASKALATQQPSYHIIIGSRDVAKGTAAAKRLALKGLSVSSIQLDITDDASIEAAVKTIDTTYGRLDVLINNAGVMYDCHPGGGDPTMSAREVFTRTFEVNVIGSACVTDAFLPLLKKSSLPRIVWVSSGGGSITKSTDPTSMVYQVDFKAYQSSKAAVNMLAVRYAMLLQDVGGKSNAVCPGLVNTKLTNYNAYGSTPDLGAEIIVKMAVIGKDGPTATFSNMQGSLSW